MALRQNTGPGILKSRYVSGLVQAIHGFQRWITLRYAARPESVLRTPCGLRCVARGREDAIGIVSLADAINCETAQALGSTLLESLAGGRNVILSMSGVTAIDSAGVAVLVQAVAAARYRGLNFALVAVSQEVAAILDLYQVKPLFPEYRHLVDAERQVCGASQAW